MIWTEWLFCILPCVAMVYPAQLSVPQPRAQLSLMPPSLAGVLSCPAPSCLQMGTENCIFKAQMF